MGKFIANIIIICLLFGIYSEFKDSNNINNTNNTNEATEVVKESVSSTSTMQEVKTESTIIIPQITYETRNNSELHGKEVYAIGMFNHHSYSDLQNSLLFNVDVESVFFLDIVNYEDDLYGSEIVRVEGIFNI